MSNTGGSNQTVTTDAELAFRKNGSVTNDNAVFRFDPTDPGGLLILQEGWYMAAATVNYVSGDIAVVRSMYVMTAALSSGPLAALGNAFGDGGGFQLGQGQGSAGAAEVVSGGPSKGTLSQISIASIAVGANDPARMAVALIHAAGDYTVGASLPSSLTVTQISPVFGLPPEAP